MIIAMLCKTDAESDTFDAFYAAISRAVGKSRYTPFVTADLYPYLADSLGPDDPEIIRFVKCSTQEQVDVVLNMLGYVVDII